MLRNLKDKLALMATGAVIALTLTAGSALAYDFSGPAYLTYDGGTTFLPPDGTSGPVGGFGGGPLSPNVPLSFNGITQLDVRGLHRNSSAIPPDSHGAIGATQFFETTNGAYAVYDKVTGTRTALWADGAFWLAAGQPTHYALDFANGDSRVLFDKPSQKWIIESFDASLENIQIAVSDTSDALGTWKSTSFTAYADGHGTGIADYPTLAIDNNAIYIGTNDFSRTAGTCPIPSISFCGTTMNVISRKDIFGLGGPATGSLKQFYTPYFTVDDGFAPQGVNQLGSDTGKVVAIGVNNFGPVRYDISNAGKATATKSASTLVDPITAYDPNQPAAQPDGTRNIDASDDRISSAAWEFKGKIYAIHTITVTGEQHTSLEMYVIDAASNAIVQRTIIGDGVHDYFQGSITVNGNGQVVVGYNKSGFGVGENVALWAQAFDPNPGYSGALHLKGAAILLHLSPIGNYHNGSTQGSPAAGRQRWGDYAQVTVDPTNSQSFWIIGEYALGYLPSPTNSFSRWGDWIANVTIGGVPEPQTWSMMIAGAGLIGASLRRRRRPAAA